MMTQLEAARKGIITPKAIRGAWWRNDVLVVGAQRGHLLIGA